VERERVDRLCTERKVICILYIFFVSINMTLLLCLIYFLFCRLYNLNTTAIYNQCYIRNTHTLLLGPPSIELTQDEQVYGPKILSSAYHRDNTVMIDRCMQVLISRCMQVLS
jgi:hypothetical protein